MKKTLRDWLDAGAAQLRPSQPVDKPAKEIDPPGAIPASLVASAKVASWIAFFTLVYFLGLYTLDIARDRAEALHLTKAGTWAGDIKFWAPHIIGYAGVAIGIPYVAKIAIPVFMSLDWKTNLWPKAWALFIALAVSLVVIAGTFTVQGHSIVEKDREALVAQETQQQGVAALQARRAAIEERWKTLTDSSNTTLQAQAARAGVAGWDAYIATARQQAAAGTISASRLALIERAKGSAIAAEEYQKQMDDLTAQIASAPTAASAAARVETEGAGWIQSTLAWLEGTRAILLSLVMDIVCLMMPWIALRLEQARNRQLAAFRGEDFIARDGRPAWATEAQMIPDLREEAPIDVKPMDARYQGEYITDPETRAVKKWIAGYEKKYPDGSTKYFPGHYRATGRFDPLPKDEPGVVLDSDSRAARRDVEEGPVDENAVDSEELTPEPMGDNEKEASTASEELTPETSADALYASLFNETGPEQPGVDYGESFGPPAPEKKLPNGEGVMLQAAE